MVADETRLAEMNRVRAVTEDIEYVKNEKRDVRRVRDIPRVTVKRLDMCRKCRLRWKQWVVGFHKAS